jgi:WD domain, G-beta repeat.
MEFIMKKTILSTIALNAIIFQTIIAMQNNQLQPSTSYDSTIFQSLPPEMQLNIIKTIPPLGKKITKLIYQTLITPTPQQLSLPTQPGERITAISISPNSEHTALISSQWKKKSEKSDQLIMLSRNQNPEAIINPDMYKITSLAFSHDSSHIIVSADNNAFMINTQTKNPTQTFSHNKRVLSAHVSNDGAYAITGSKDCSAIIWDTKTGNKIHTLKHDTDYFYTNMNHIIKVAFSPDSTYAITGSPLEVNLWNVKTGNKIKTFIAFENDPLAVTSASAYLSNDNDDSAPDLESIFAATFSHSSKYLLIQFQYGAALWDISTNTLMHSFEKTDEGDLDDNKYYDHIISFSPDDKKVLIAHNSSAIIGDVESGDFTQLLKNTDIASGNFSPCGNYVITTSGFVNNYGSSSSLWDAKTGKKITDLTRNNSTNTDSYIPIINPDNHYTLCDTNEGGMTPLVHKTDISSLYATLKSLKELTLNQYELLTAINQVVQDNEDLKKTNPLARISRAVLSSEQTNTFQSLGIAMQNGLRRTVILKPKQQASNNNDTNHNPAKKHKTF